MRLGINAVKMIAATSELCPRGSSKLNGDPIFGVRGLCPCSGALHELVVNCLNISQSHGRPELPRSRCGSTPIRDNEPAQFAGRAGCKPHRLPRGEGREFSLDILSLQELLQA